MAISNIRFVNSFKLNPVVSINSIEFLILASCIMTTGHLLFTNIYVMKSGDYRLSLSIGQYYTDLVDTPER